MSRFSSYGKTETPWQPDGDKSFVGIDMFHDPPQLQPGMVRYAENKRIRDGRLVKRPGTVYPGDFNGMFVSTIIGSGVFRNPNGQEVLLIAEAGVRYVWALQFGRDPIKILYSTTELVTRHNGYGVVSFVQSFDKILMLRAPVQAGTPAMKNLIWNGNVDQTVDTNRWTPVTFTSTGDNAEVKLAWQGEPFQDRILFYLPYWPAPAASPSVMGRDQFIMSDALDYNSYDDVFGVFRINAGQSDMITKILGYFKGAVIVLMYRSIHMLENFSLMDPTLASQRELAPRLGSVGNRFPITTGREVYFLSEPTGVYAISEVIEDSIAVEPEPVSLQIDKIIQRINWPEAHIRACSEKLGDLMFFAVPLDNCVGGNNAVLVMNGANRQWYSAPDWWDDVNFRINNMHTTFYNGVRSIFGIDYGAQRVYLLYSGGAEDEINGGIVPIRDRFATRGYDLGDPTAFKRFQRVRIAVSTYAPDAVVTAVSDGFNERKELGTIQKDRTKFYVHAHPPFDENRDDATEPKRQDYSVMDEDFAADDFETYPEGPIPFIPATPLIWTGNLQESVEAKQIRQNGRWVSIEVEDGGGRCDTLAVTVDAIPIQEGFKPLA